VKNLKDVGLFFREDGWGVETLIGPSNHWTTARTVGGMGKWPEKQVFSNESRLAQRTRRSNQLLRGFPRGGEIGDQFHTLGPGASGGFSERKQWDEIHGGVQSAEKTQGHLGSKSSKFAL